MFSHQMHRFCCGSAFLFHDNGLYCKFLRTGSRVKSMMMQHPNWLSHGPICPCTFFFKYPYVYCRSTMNGGLASLAWASDFKFIKISSLKHKYVSALLWSERTCLCVPVLVLILAIAISFVRTHYSVVERPLHWHMVCVHVPVCSYFTTTQTTGLAYTRQHFLCSCKHRGK